MSTDAAPAKRKRIYRRLQTGRAVYRTHHIFEALADQGLTVAWFVRQVGCDYSLLYKVRDGSRGVPDWLVEKAVALLELPEAKLFSDPIEPRPVKGPYKPTKLPMPERFWAKVKRDGLDHCWPWMGPRNKTTGYGQFGINGGYVYAHRMAYELAKGPIPARLNVLHDCDNPQCCNPHHLYAGTQAENVADRDRRGRHWTPKGEAHSQSKLTEQDVRDIRALGTSLPDRDIAARFGISRAYVWQVRTGRAWKHVIDGSEALNAAD